MSAAARGALSIEALSIDYRSDDGWVNAVNGVSLSIGRGEIMGLAGESGCGKSTVAAAALGERRPGSRIAAGRVLLDGVDLLALDGAALQPLRGRRVGFVPQNPTASLSPSMPIGRQIAEILEAHGVARGREAARAAVEALAEVGLPDPEATAKKLPHQLSGGQQQRVVIAMALVCRPGLLVLDEPTTGLDVTTQRRILELLADARARFDVAMLYISHDLAALSILADRIGVMYAGDLVETGDVAALFSRPRHPYTRGLVLSAPRLDRRSDPAAALEGALRRGGLPPGCRFSPRCAFAEPRCARARPPLERTGPGGAAACWRWRDLPASAFG